MDKRKFNKGRPVGLSVAQIEANQKASIEERAERFGPGAGNKRLRPERQEEVRAKIQASHIVRRLQQCGDGEIELSQQQVQAYKILLDKSVASLQATEITEVSTKDKMTEAEILEKIAALVKRDPKLADMVRLRDVVDVSGAPSEAAAGDDTCAACGGAVQYGVCLACGAMVQV